MGQQQLQELLGVISDRLRRILGGQLNRALLYGSYARGDYDSESDVDVAVLVNVSRDELEVYHQPIVRLMTDLSLQYDVLVNFALIPVHEFELYKEALAYYRNIEQEGALLGA